MDRPSTWKGLNIAHRGASTLAPENTLTAFHLAVVCGADMIELDVQRTIDGELVVFHDHHVSRLTNGHGLVVRQTLANLRRLSIRCEQIPTLQEVLERFSGHLGLNIELKARGTAAAVAALLARWPSPARRDEVPPYLVSSFLYTELRDPVLRASGLPLAVLTSKVTRTTLAVATELGAWSVNCSLRALEPTTVDRVHAAGFRLLVYTVNEPADLQRCMDLGVDGLFTDHPERLRSLQNTPP
ncbi:MAG: hypothetical protein A2284_15925 [Deltaproteobacteria bacterium RIFOXYA12_FULL_61_11]|nr:MAG: hypothetical protein A2284_15925 [Deltaproteobacteria bacterium RIFOXYA12_FULL_61_11]